jgi:hypothetical protein
MLRRESIRASCTPVEVPHECAGPLRKLNLKRQVFGLLVTRTSEEFVDGRRKIRIERSRHQPEKVSPLIESIRRVMEQLLPRVLDEVSRKPFS